MDPGVLLKDPGVLLKDPGVLLKDPGVSKKTERATQEGGEGHPSGPPKKGHPRGGEGEAETPPTLVTINSNVRCWTTARTPEMACRCRSWRLVHPCAPRLSPRTSPRPGGQPASRPATRTPDSPIRAAPPVELPGRGRVL